MVGDFKYLQYLGGGGLSSFGKSVFIATIYCCVTSTETIILDWIGQFLQSVNRASGGCMCVPLET